MYGISCTLLSYDHIIFIIFALILVNYTHIKLALTDNHNSTNNPNKCNSKSHFAHTQTGVCVCMQALNFKLFIITIISFIV